MILVFVQVLIVAFFINLAWEIAHSLLYKTALALPTKKYVALMFRMSFLDGLLITLLYGLTVLIFRNTDILNNSYQLVSFILLAIIFSFADEKISLKLRRWRYTKAMPKMFGVGLTPLMELAITGILTFFVVFRFL